MLIIAHRGASRTEPENTLRAFCRAVELGCPWIECDVRLTRDGVPVIIHDATANRTTDGRGRISGITYKALRKFNAGKNEKVPSLQETLEFAQAHNINLVLEIKDLRALAPSLRLLKQNSSPPKKGEASEGVSRNVIISSFSPFLIIRAKRLLSTLTTALIIENPLRDWVKTAKKSHADMVHVFAPLATKKKIAAAHQAGLQIWAWTVNDTRIEKRLLKKGVDGIFTDYPEQFMT